MEKLQSTKHHSKGILDYVYSDLWEPLKVATLSGVRYFMTIIDDYLRRVWVFCLKTKDQVFDSFKK